MMFVDMTMGFYGCKTGRNSYKYGLLLQIIPFFLLIAGSRRRKG